MEKNKCVYNKGNAPMITYSYRDQANCPKINCSEHGYFYKCYYESCRTPQRREDD